VLEYIAFAIALGFVALVEGLLNPFWLWNAIPFGLALGLLKRAEHRDLARLPTVLFAVLSSVVSLYVHLAVFLDWGGLATGSSTAPLIFIFLPLYAVIAGAIGFAAGAVVVRSRGDP